MNVTQAELAPYSDRELAAELDRRIAARTDENRRALARTTQLQRLRSAVVSARHDLTTVEAEHQKRLIALKGLRELGMNVPPNDIRLAEIKVEQSAPALSAAELRVATAESTLATFEAA